MSLGIRKMQIKMTLKFHLTHIRMAKIKGQHTMAGMWSKNTLPLLVVVQTCTTTLEINLIFSQKTRKSSTSRSSYITSWYITKGGHYTTCSTIFIANLFVTPEIENKLDASQLKIRQRKWQKLG